MTTLTAPPRDDVIADLRCPLLRDFYSPKKAQEDVRSNLPWSALYGQETLDLGLEIARRRSQGNYLKGEAARSWLSKNHAICHLTPSARWASELYFSDPAGVFTRERIYDAHKDQFVNSRVVQEKLQQAMKPLTCDLEAFLLVGDDFSTCNFHGQGERILLPFATPILFLGPYRRFDEEILLSGDVEIKDGRIYSPSLLAERMKVCIREDNITFHEVE